MPGAEGTGCVLLDPQATAQVGSSRCPIVELHRDLAPMRSGELEYLQGGAPPTQLDASRYGVPYRLMAFWVRADASPGGEDRPVEVWHFLGWDCPVSDTSGPVAEVKAGGCYAPPHILARHFPGHFNLRRVYALDHCGHIRYGGCSVQFLYRGRLAKVYSKAAAPLAVTAALGLLERLARDTASPPQPGQTMARAERAMEDCRLARHLLTGTDQCGLAVHLAASVLEQLPDAAARIMLEAMVDHGYRAVGHDSDWERWYAQDLLAALTRIGRADGADAMRAHSLVMRSRTSSAEERARSYAALHTVAPRVLGAHLHLLPIIESQLAEHAGKQNEEPRKLVEFLGATLAHTEREHGADSDAAFRVLFSYCQRRMWDVAERATLGRCADALIKQWSHRDPNLKNLHESIPPIRLGLYITSMLRECETVAGDDCSPALVQSRLDIVRRLLAQVPGAAEDEQVRRKLGTLPVSADRADGGSAADSHASEAEVRAGQSKRADK
jgi:hypothetical protein